ncbi:hypothetical protein EJ04DRAFT_514308 [Polyplosphaeria fusca]|uniref:Uncharacterized protein n=1 Tax=Polyplosphaeria fusca TaxID=682080 RepID=A0A9P4QVU1_9PLEO|nr:hypothetical protein EJ04DRAFT_514308 [Polyplosphaeria fusca]
MAEPLSSLSPEKLNPISTDEDEMTWHDPPSSPFVSHLDVENQENIAPASSVAPTPMKQAMQVEEMAPQSAFKISSPSKKFGFQAQASPVKTSPTKQLMDEFDDAEFRRSVEKRATPKKASPMKQPVFDRPESAMSNRSCKNVSPAKSSRAGSVEPAFRLSTSAHDLTSEIDLSPVKRPSSSHNVPELRENEGLTVAMKLMEETRTEHHESSTTYHTESNLIDVDDLGAGDDTEFNPDGPDFTSADIDDTCFSAFSEMPNLDMTKFAFMRKSPTKNGLVDQSTPRGRAPMTPSTVRRNERSLSPTPRRDRTDNDTTNLLLDFTAQMESFSVSRRGSPSRGRHSPVKSSTESNLLSYINNQRSPAKGATHVPSTPGQNRQLLNLLDFELPPPPTPRSVPTVTIRELESLKSTFQSQISSLTASLSGKEAQVESLVKAVSDAERRVGEAQELVRDERSSREHAEAQMTDWKKKGEEVQKLLQDVQAELARNDTEREALLARVVEAERRAEESEQRASDLETRAIEAESKNVDMTTFINPDESSENRKIYSEIECQTAIAEKVNEVARDLHSAYKAKHEKKIKALKENYQKKADERCKDLRLQIIRLERQVEEAEKKTREDTFSKVLPGNLKKEDVCDKCGRSEKASASNADDFKRLEDQKSEIENLKAKLAGLQSELSSLKKSSEQLMKELEAERVEKGELVAAAEQMLSLCGEKMEELQQEDLRRSQLGGAPPTAPPSQTRPGSALGVGRPGSAMGERLGAMGADKPSGIGKPSGLRAPGGFGFGGQAPALSRSTSGSKSRIMSNIERMGGGRSQD